MRQFVLPPTFNGGGSIKISGADSKYILKVLRLKTGDGFPAVDSGGNRFMLEITAIGADYFKAVCTASNPVVPAAETANIPRIILLQCLPKGKKLELIVRQAVESGAGMIIPIESAHSVAHIKDDRSAKKTGRLKKIAEEAAQQSGNRGVPEILEPVKIASLPEILSEHSIKGLKLFFHQKRLEKSSLHGYLYNPADSVCILIGPEGGLSNTETDFLLASGFYPVYLGENVLRTETAAVYALGAVKTILLEKSAWKTDIRK